MEYALWTVVIAGLLLLVLIRVFKVSDLDRAISIRERKGSLEPSTPGIDQSPDDRRRNIYSRRNIKLAMQVVVSLAILVSALIIIFRSDSSNSEAQKWAFGAIGTVMGFWLKG
jgi:hypothetical protein